MMYYFLKRVLDFSVALVLFVILLPLFIPVSLALLLSGEGYIFYFQDRIGQFQKKFPIWKFATMLKDSPNMKGGEITTRKDPRITPVGRYLRITKVNELPQIINVLKGDMSLVGPRPLMEVSFNQYSQKVKETISTCKPGITGIGSIVFRDEEMLVTATNIPPKEYYKRYIFPYKGELEIWYQKNASFVYDLIIIFLTAWQIIFSKSDLVFQIFKDLPPKPIELTLEGAKNIRTHLPVTKV